MLDDSEKTMIKYQKSNTLTIQDNNSKEPKKFEETAPNLFSELSKKMHYKSKINEFMVIIRSL